MTIILNLILRICRVTKILNFALKIKGVVGRVADAKSSDLATPFPPKFGTCTCSVEYKKLLKTVYIKTGAASSSFIQSFSNLAETFNASIALD